MGIYLLYILIILVIIILFILVKDKRKFISGLGISSVVSGISLIVIGFIINILLHTFLNNFNISRISSLIFNKFIYISIFLLGIGLIMLVISKIVNKRVKNIS